MKALALYSGGLDSIIAVKIAKEAGLEVEAIHFLNPFHQHPEQHLTSVFATTRKLGIRLHLQEFGEDYLRVIENPAHGYGKRLNPCLDCRIYQLCSAKAHMSQVGADILITGEVVDQRPNSQRRDAMDIVERDAGVRGLLLRPLCAKHLRPIPAEENGQVNRDKLLDLKGRGRTTQMELAAKYGITDYPAPGGGCLLTYEEYSCKIKDLLENNGQLSLSSVHLLRYGRHLRLSPQVKLIVGKDQTENTHLQHLAGRNDLLIQTKNEKGPVSLYTGPFNEATLRLAAAITAGYSKVSPDQPVEVECFNEKESFGLSVIPLSREAIATYFVHNIPIK